MNRSIWHSSADTNLIAPLISRYPHHRKIGTGQHYSFSAWLSDFGVAEYDFHDLSGQDLTGEQIYNELLRLLDGENYMGEIRLTKRQIYLLQDYYAELHGGGE